MQGVGPIFVRGLCPFPLEYPGIIGLVLLSRAELLHCGESCSYSLAEEDKYNFVLDLGTLELGGLLDNKTAKLPTMHFLAGRERDMKKKNEDERESKKEGKARLV